MKLLHPFYNIQAMLTRDIPEFRNSPNQKKAWELLIHNLMTDYLPSVYPDLFKPEEKSIRIDKMEPHHRIYTATVLWAYEFKMAGENTFRLGPYMADRLSSASLKGVEMENVKLPFPFFYLQFESPVLVLDREGAEDGRPVWAQGAYVMGGTDHERVRENDFQVEMTLLKEGDTHPFFVSAWPTIDPKTGTIHDTDTTGSSIGPISANLRNNSEGWVNSDWYVRSSKKLAEIVRTSINLALYLASVNSETQEIDEGAAAKSKLRRKVKRLTGRAKRRAQERLDAHGGIRYIQVGPTKERQARDYKRRTGKTMGRGWRRAHWHSYWVGPRTDIHGNAQLGEEKVLKWIDACEVNPHLEGGSPRVYSVREAV